MCDVLRPDRLLRETTSERGPDGVVTLGGQQLVQANDITNPDARAPMCELGQIVQRCGSQRQEMLPLQLAFRALAGHGGHLLRAVLRQRRLGVRLEEPLMDGFEAARDNPHAIPKQEQRSGDPDRVGGHRVGMRVMQDRRRGADDDRDAEREILRRDLYRGEPWAFFVEPPVRG